MIRNDPDFFAVQTPNLRLVARHVPWDSDIYGTVVAQITDAELRDVDGASRDYAAFEKWCDTGGVGIVSCRLPQDRLRESMFLEQKGFRFIEMVLHPKIQLSRAGETVNEGFVIACGSEGDLPALEALAERAFGYERYHVDPRLDPRLGDRRYGRWVRNALRHDSQQLLKVLESDRLIALFIVERQAEASVYWHLTAIAPEWQGQGFGRRVWRAMLRRHQDDGLLSVATTISARNTPVLNLYSQLQFRFDPPEMTFHWVRDAK
jgi:GNAT superfamily N-acetyltransferase